MERDVVNYHFPNGISIEKWEYVRYKLMELYPGIKWASGSNLDGFHPIHGKYSAQIFYLSITDDDGRSRLYYSSRPNDRGITGPIVNGEIELLSDWTDTNEIFDQLLESENTFKQKYSIGQTLTPIRDLYFNYSTHPSDRFATVGKIYTITNINRENHRYIIVDDSDNEHNFSEGYLDNNFIVVDDYEETNNLFDQLNESEEDDFSWVPQNFDIPELGEEFLIIINHPFNKLDLFRTIIELLSSKGYRMVGGVEGFMSEIKKLDSDIEFLYIRPSGNRIKFGTSEKNYIEKVGMTFSESNPIYL